MRCLNVGSGTTWVRDGWDTTDHKARRGATAWRMDARDGTYDLLFSSHMIEHIPHYKIDDVLRECNRVLRIGGGIRLVCPNLAVIARAYVSADHEQFERFIEEDTTIRRDLGLGGMLMNFIVSPGADNLLLSRNGECIGGYAHVYAYDFQMLRNLLERHGFGDVRDMRFCESSYPELTEPLHAVGSEAIWPVRFNWATAARGITGFDKNPLTSLFVEARKIRDDHAPANAFGVPGERGLDPASFDLFCITRAYLAFTREKLRAVSRRGIRPGVNVVSQLRAWPRSVAARYLPSRVKEALKHTLRRRQRQ